MDVLLVLILLIACGLVGVMAKHGAERELRAREERWARPPVPVGHQAWRQSTGSRLGATPTPPASTTTQTTTSDRSTPAAGPIPAPAQAGATRPRSARPAPAPRAPGPPAQRARPPSETRPININQAPAEELRNLPGVGMRAAERIVAHRKRHGGFASVDDLQGIEGFDHHRVSRLAPNATV